MIALPVIAYAVALVMSMRLIVHGASATGPNRVEAAGKVTKVVLPLAGAAPPIQLAPVPQLSFAPEPFHVVVTGSGADSMMSLPVPPT